MAQTPRNRVSRPCFLLSGQLGQGERYCLPCSGEVQNRPLSEHPAPWMLYPSLLLHTLPLTWTPAMLSSGKPRAVNSETENCPLPPTHIKEANLVWSGVWEAISGCPLHAQGGCHNNAWIKTGQVQRSQQPRPRGGHSRPSCAGLVASEGSKQRDPEQCSCWPLSKPRAPSPADTKGHSHQTPPGN